ncbi:MAG: tannase/feruloyl esterase family alpha/beta hydrolase [Nevskiales bacterium]
MLWKKTGFIGACLIVAGVLPAPGRAADEPAEAPQRAACDELKFADFAGIQDAPTRVMDSRVAEAGGEIPATCLLRGHVAPQVGFQMKLPLANWNGKLAQLGTGGYAGSTQSAGDLRLCDEMVRRGYACVNSDYGHTSGITAKSLALLDGVWAYNNLQAKLDYGYRGIYVVALAAKAVAKHYYGSEQQRSYFIGCSNGGRQAMVAAQRFPWEFDGILALEPAINISGAFLSFAYNERAVTGADGQPLFTPAELEMLHNSSIARCDLDDGLKDGIIGNPSACVFDPAQVACSDERKEACLSPAQIAAANKVYAGGMTSTGRQWYRGGVMPGAERGSFGFAAARPLVRHALKDFVRYLAFMPDAGPGAKLSDVDFDQDYKRLALMEALYESSNPDLRPLKEAGGKLMIVQGWDDSGTPFPLNTIDYYETMQRTMGGPKQTQDFARLFMVPGRQHCVGGEGASAADFIGQLEGWVEQGKAPDMIKTYHIESDNPIDHLREPTDPAKIKFSRPLYPYPLAAKYKGSGDVNDYRSFKPVDLSTIRVK